MAKKKTPDTIPNITPETPGVIETTGGILNVTGVQIDVLHPEDETTTTDGPKAVETLSRAVEAVDGTLGHSEIIAVVNRKLIDLQGERDVLV